MADQDQTVREVEQHVQCNLCGLSCTIGAPGDKWQDRRAGLIEAKVVGGYESTPGNGWGALDDCTSYTFSLCEFCLDWLFTRCKVPPKTFYRVGSDEPPWRPAAERVKDDDWRRLKDEFRQESERRRKARDGVL